MGKKSTPANKPSAEAPDANVVVVEKPKKKRIKTVSVPLVEPEPVVVETVVVPPPTPEEEDVETVVDSVEVNMETTTPVEEAPTTEKKKRRLVSKDSFLKASEDFHKDLVPILEEGNHKKLLKTFKVILNDAYRLLKIKTHQKKQKDATNSGFMRPVKPSVALEKFLAHVGEDLSQPLTRAHLTTVICKYIKENDLQNPKDRRIIFPDEEFKKLFQITEDDTEPLTYYNIQKRIQTHVSRLEEAPPTTA